MTVFGACDTAAILLQLVIQPRETLFKFITVIPTGAELLSFRRFCEVEGPCVCSCLT